MTIWPQQQAGGVCWFSKLGMGIENCFQVGIGSRFRRTKILRYVNFSSAIGSFTNLVLHICQRRHCLCTQDVCLPVCAEHKLLLHQLALIVFKTPENIGESRLVLSGTYLPLKKFSARAISRSGNSMEI